MNQFVHGKATFNIPTPRYHATFQHGDMEIEKEGDNLARIKQWIAGYLGDYPSPTHALIRDTLEDKTIFEERNPHESN